MLKKWCAKLFVLLAAVCVLAAQPAVRAEVLPEAAQQPEDQAAAQNAGISTYAVASGYCGAEGDGKNLKWELKRDGTMTISGSGDMMDYNPKRMYIVYHIM